MSVPGHQVTLFLIEDDDVDATDLERGLARRRIANPIIRARDGVQALEMLRNRQVERPFVILLDLQLPRMNGREFLDELRSDPELSDAVVFVLTTSRASQDIESSYQRHVAGYFVKDDVGPSFQRLLKVLKGYWKIVYLPEDV